MSLAPAVVLGEQRPQVGIRPSRRGLDHADAEEAVWFASRYGLFADDWQSWVIEGWLARVKTTKRLASSQCGLSVPRQNGKNTCLEIFELYCMVALGRKILHTAHEVKTARKAFLRLASFFENDREWPELAAMVVEIRRTNGQECIRLNNGASIEFIARSKGSGRGFTVDILVCDEAQEMSDDALAALLPTISAAPSGDPQMVFTGTPPSSAMNGEVFTRIRDSALAGRNTRVCWDEWCFDEGGDPDDPAQIAKANPGVGIRLGLDIISDERAAMDDETYRRERGGVWAASGGASRLVTVDQWTLTGRSKAPDGIRSLAVVFSFDGKRQAVAGAVKHAEGLHIELVGAHSGPRESGVASLVSWLCEDPAKPQRWRTLATIAIAGSSGSTTLYQSLRDAGVPARVLHVMSTGEYLTACSMLLDGIVDGTVTHSAIEGQAALDDSVAVCDKKTRGSDGAWGWVATTAEGDETPIEAMSVAAWAAKTTKRRPGRRQTGGVM